MKNAMIAQVGTPRELYEQPASEFVADFIGEVNIIDAEISAIHEGVATVHVGNLKLNLDSRGLSPGAAKLAVRPNRIFVESLASSDTPGGADALSGTVKKATYVGDRIEYKLATDRGTFFCTSEATDRQYGEGNEVAVWFDSVGPVLLPA